MYYFGRYEHAKNRGYQLSGDFFLGLTILLFFAYEMSQGNYWAFWFVLFLSQWCGIVTVTQSMADRYCSLPMVGLMMILIKYVSLLPAEFQLAVYIAFTSTWIMKYSRMYRAYINLSQFYEYHMEIDPACIESRVYYSEKVSTEEPFKAMTLLNDGLKFNPYDFKLLIAMVLLNMQIGRYDQAEKFMQQAEKVIPLGEEKDIKLEFGKLRLKIMQSSLPRSQRRKLERVTA